MRKAWNGHHIIGGDLCRVEVPSIIKKGREVRLANRMRLGLWGILVGLALIVTCLSSANASAHALIGGDGYGPRIMLLENRPVIPDVHGCGAVVITGKNFYRSLASRISYARIRASNAYGSVYVIVKKNKDPFIAVDATGKLPATTVTVCGLKHVETIILNAIDTTTHLQSNFITFKVI